MGVRDYSHEATTSRPDPVPVPPVPLHIQLLGAFRVTVEGQAIPDSTWRLQKSAAIVKLLALAPDQRLARDQFLELLWPELAPEAAGNSFHYALHAARRALSVADAPADLLRLHRGTLALRASALVVSDVATFEAAAREAITSRSPERYQRALALYTGDLLPEDRYEDWAAGRRTELRERWLRLALDLARLHRDAGRHAEAIDLLERILAFDSAHEDAHVALMRLYALTGQRGQALRQWARLVDALRRHLDAEPDPASRQLYAAILAGRFPAKATSGGTPAAPPTPAPPRHNLPVALTNLIGRARERGAVRDLLAPGDAGPRLVTLTGTGGIGKTSLALAVARDLAELFPDGVWFVDLAGLSDPALVARAVAQILGVREVAAHPLADTLAAALRRRTLLLVLDNCEHLVAACAGLAQHLLLSCPDLRLLATSRVSLGVSSEVTWRVPSLAIPAAPDGGDDEASVALVGNAAVRLFVDRARQRRPSFALDASSAASVAAICRQLDGIPLAIELAASRLVAFAPEQIASRLGDALGLLLDGARTAPARHRTLRAALDWSHDLLGVSERRVLRRLAVFRGGWTVEAAEAVCTLDDLPVATVPDLLSHLVDHSLVQVGAGDGAGSAAEGWRYRLLEPVRQYAAEQLAVSGEEATARRCHALHYLALAESAEPALRDARRAPWLDQLGREIDNLRAALAWARAANGGAPTDDLSPAEIGLRLASAPVFFWYLRGLWREGYEWLTDLLAMVDPEMAESSRVKATFALGVLDYLQGEYALATARLEACAASWRAGGEERRRADAHYYLGWVAIHRGDLAVARDRYGEAAALCRADGDRRGLARALFGLAEATVAADLANAEGGYEESAALFRLVGDRWGLSLPLTGLGRLALRRDDAAKARALLLEGLALRREAGDRWLTAYSLHSLGEVARYQGDGITAGAYYEEAAALYRALGRPRDLAWPLRSLGYIALWQGDLSRATTLLREALSTECDLDSPIDLAACLVGAAGVRAHAGEFVRAARLLGASARLLDGAEGAPEPTDRRDRDQLLAAVRADLDKARWEASMMAGRDLSREAAIAEAFAALADLPPVEPPAAVVGPAPDLTAREREVIALVAEGRTSREIAVALGMSRRTVETHIGHLLRKLGAASRADAAQRARDLELLPTPPR